MSKLLEHIIRQMLFEQVNGNVQTTVGSNKQNAIEAGAIQSFKFVSNPDSTQPKFNDSEAQNSINAGRFYQKNMIRSIDKFFTQKNYPGYNNVLNDQYVVIIGNMPTDTNSFTILFWVFTKEEFFGFSKPKTEDDRTPEDDEDVEVLDDTTVTASRFKILQAPAFVYDEYLNVYTSTNEKLSEINQGVTTDVVTLAATEKNREKIEFIESSEFPKKISTFTCFAIVQNDDTIQQVININSSIQEQIYTYITYQYDEWIKWSKNIQGISDEPGTLENSYKVRQACNIEKTTWSNVKVLNDLIKQQYSETEYNDLLFDDKLWKQKNITNVSDKIQEYTNKIITDYTNYINTILNQWTDANTSNYLIWLGLLNNKFGGNMQNLYKVYDKELRRFALTKRSDADPNKWVFDDGVSGYQTDRGRVIHDTSIEYLENIRDSLRGYTWYTYECKLKDNEMIRLYPRNEDTVKTIDDSIFLLNTQSHDEYFELLGDKLQQAGLNTILAPDIDPFDNEIIPVEEP